MLLSFLSFSFEYFWVKFEFLFFDTFSTNVFIKVWFKSLFLNSSYLNSYFRHLFRVTFQHLLLPTLIGPLLLKIGAYINCFLSSQSFQFSFDIDILNNLLNFFLKDEGRKLFYGSQLNFLDLFDQGIFSFEHFHTELFALLNAIVDDIGYLVEKYWFAERMDVESATFAGDIGTSQWIFALLVQTYFGYFDSWGWADHIGVFNL